MPATFRAFLQGLAAAGPEVVRLMQYRQQVDLQKKELGQRDQSLAEQKRQWDEGKAGRDAYTNATNAGVDSQKRQLDLDERRVTLAETLGKTQVEIGKYEAQIKKAEAELAQATAPEQVKLLKAQVANLAAQASEAYSRVELAREQAKILGVQGYDAQVDLKSKVVALRAAGYNDPGFQKFYGTQFETYDDMFRAAASMDMSPNTRINVLGLMGTVLTAMQHEQQIRASALNGAKDAKQFRRMADLYDKAPGTVSVADMFDSMGIPIGTDNGIGLKAAAEQPGQQGGTGTPFKLPSASGIYEAGQPVRDFTSKVGAGLTIGAAGIASDLYKSNPLNPGVGITGGNR